ANRSDAVSANPNWPVRRISKPRTMYRVIGTLYGRFSCCHSWLTWYALPPWAGSNEAAPNLAKLTPIPIPRIATVPTPCRRGGMGTPRRARRTRGGAPCFGGTSLTLKCQEGSPDFRLRRDSRRALKGLD